MIKKHIKHIEVYIIERNPDVVWIHKDDIEEFMDYYVNTTSSSHEYIKHICRDTSRAYDGVRLRFMSSFVAKNKYNVLRESWTPEYNHTLNSVQDKKYIKCLLHMQKPIGNLLVKE